MTSERGFFEKKAKKKKRKENPQLTLKKFTPKISSLFVDINECTDGTAKCDLNSTICNNFIPGFECECKPGYVPVKNQNNNECEGLDSHPSTLVLVMQYQLSMFRNHIRELQVVLLARFWSSDQNASTLAAT